MNTNNSFGFTSLNLVGALSGVKSIMTGLQGTGSQGVQGPQGGNKQEVSQQNQKHIKVLLNTLDKLRLQTPETHLGLVLAFSDSLLSPVTHPDLEFTWARVNPTPTKISPYPLLTPGLSANNAWYPPCADDIGSIIRIQCRDTYNYGLLREFDSDVIRPDDNLVDKVEDAISKDRMTAKIILSSVPSNLADDKILCDVDQFELAGSIEIGSKGILICEKGFEYGGLRYLPSSAIQVRCCQPCSLILSVPIPYDKSYSTLTWAGKEEGSLFQVLHNHVINPKNSSSPSSVHKQVQYLDILISCRDRMIRDSLVLSIRAMAAFVISPDELSIETSSEHLLRRRLEILPWNLSGQESVPHQSVLKKDELMTTNAVFDSPESEDRSLLSILQETKESLEREKMLNNELELQLFKVLHKSENEPPADSTLSSFTVNLSTSSVRPLAMTSRHRDESGDTSCSDNPHDNDHHVEDHKSHHLLGEVEVIATMNEEIELLKDKCVEISRQLSQTKSENVDLQIELMKYRQNSTSNSDELLSQIQQHLSDVDLIFQSACADNSKDESMISQSSEIESEFSGTDSSEHSMDHMESHHANEPTLDHLKKIFDTLNTDVILFMDSNSKSKQLVEDLRNRVDTLSAENCLLSRTHKESEDRFSQLEKNFEMSMITKVNDLRAEHQTEMAEATNRWLRQQSDYETHIADLQKTIESYQTNEYNSSKNIASLETSLGRLTEEYHEYKRQSTQSSLDLTQYNHSIVEEFNRLKEKHSTIEQRNHDLQNEILAVSDSKHLLMKQMNASDTLKKQMNQMKSQINTLNHELQGLNQLNVEKTNEYERLNTQYLKICVELEHQKKMSEKSVEHMNEIRQRNAELEQNIQSIEGNKNGLIKENNRLRNTINQLSIDKEKLNELEPLYNQQLSVLANIHSKTSELETILTRTVQSKHQCILSLVASEINCGHLERQYRQTRDTLNHLGMAYEDVRERQRLLGDRLASKDTKISLLKEDLSISKQAEPFVIKKLNYMLAKVRGEKNHYENKAKSLSKDLQKRLLEGTPLQRELGRVTARLEELENERNAYRDAMVLACDVYAKEENALWFY